MPRRTPPRADTSHPLPSDTYRRLITDIGPAERAELDACLAGSENLIEFWERAPRAAWLLESLQTHEPSAVTRLPTEHELRLFACWCGEQTGGADPWVKLAVRGVLKPVFFKQLSGELFGAALAGSVHGAVRQVSHLRAQAYAAVDDPVEGAIGAAHSLATYLGAQPFPEPVALFVTTRKPIPGYRDPLSEVGKIELDSAGATAAEQTIADAVRRYLGNPFAGTPPTVTGDEIDRLFIVLPSQRKAKPAGRRKAKPAGGRKVHERKRRPPTGRHKNRVLLAEADDWLLLEVVLSGTARRGFRLESISYSYDEGRREQRTRFQSEPIRSAADFLREVEEFQSSSEGWDLFREFDNVLAGVRQLDEGFADEVEAAWTVVAANRVDEELIDSILFQLGRLMEIGAGDPEQWGITRDLRVVPLPLEPALSLAELERRSGKAAGVDGTPPNEWMQIAREWIESGTAVLQSEV